MSIRYPSRSTKIFIILIFTLGAIVLIFRLSDIDKVPPGQLFEHVEQTERSEINKPKLAILVPFRDRFDELLTFVPYISVFLQKQNITNFRIYIINQSSRYRFNRGSLANIGYMIAKNDCDYIAVHDVDLLPVNQNLSYEYPDRGPFHVASPEYHPNYNYSKYFGGILLIKNEHFEQVNGFSNRYFGWGLEDDEFYARIKAARIPTFRPVNLTTGKSDTFLHFHHDRKRDMFKTREQREVSRFRDRVTGLNNLQYSITSKHQVRIDEKFLCTVYNVEIYCDIEKTPWCLPMSQTKSKHTSTSRKPVDHQESDTNLSKHGRFDM